MPTDRLAPQRVAWLVLGAAWISCAPSFRPPTPPPEPGPVGKLEPRREPTGGGRQIVAGELCPFGAGGRPAIAPLLMHAVQWTSAAADVTNVIERGSVPRFVVFGVDGKPAGAFDTVGTADIGLEQAIASGTYVGASPCTADAGQGARTEDPACGPALNGCGLAVGELTRPDDPPETPKFDTGGACLSGDALAIDIDGDKIAESFPLSGVLDGVRSPTAEWSAGPTAGAACKPTFQLYNVKLVAQPEPGKKIDLKATVVLDVLGIIDLDGDGRKEVVLALRFPTIRTIVVYTAPNSAQRLELAGESESFPR
jgi:hypothetical protein